MQENKYINLIANSTLLVSIIISLKVSYLFLELFDSNSKRCDKWLK